MCFSSTVSFAAAAVLLVQGWICVDIAARLRRRKAPQRSGRGQDFRLLALIPLLLGLQQGLEGVVWLRSLPEQAAVPQDDRILWCSSLGFVFFSYIFWPLVLPLAMLLAEPWGVTAARSTDECTRRRIMEGAVALGTAVSVIDIVRVVTSSDITPTVTPGLHLAYLERDPHPNWYPFAAVGVSYVVATTAPFFISSIHGLWLFGVGISLGWGYSAIAYWEAFVSVWCFFAVASSQAIVFALMKLDRDSKKLETD